MIFNNRKGEKIPRKYFLWNCFDINRTNTMPLITESRLFADRFFSAKLEGEIYAIEGGAAIRRSFDKSVHASSETKLQRMEMEERENLPRRYYPRYRVKPHPSPVTKIQNVDAPRRNSLWIPPEFPFSYPSETKNSWKIPRLNNSSRSRHFRCSNVFQMILIFLY